MLNFSKNLFIKIPIKMMCYLIYILTFLIILTVSPIHVFAVSINPGPSREYDHGIDPVCAINNKGVALEIHRKSGPFPQLEYNLFKFEGTKMDLLERVQYDIGVSPSVDINDNGWVFEVHQWSGKLYYYLGRIDGDSLEWFKNHDYDTGVEPSVSLNNEGWFVEVHRDNDSSALWYNVGRIDQTTGTITWFEHNNYAKGATPSVALNDDGWIVAVHSSLPAYVQYYKVGYLDRTTGTITWFEQEKYDIGIEPSVSITREGNVIEVHQWGDTLYYNVGSLSGTSISWKENSRYDTGENPFVATNDHGKFFEVHKSEHDDHLWYHLGGARDYTRWMSDLKDIDKATLRDIALPGTHDSGTYHLDDFIAPTEDGNKIWQKICENTKWYIPKQTAKETAIEMGHRFGRTQYLNIYDQLKRGIRFIDLRVTYFLSLIDESKSGFYTHHGLLGEPIYKIFSDINNFMKNDAGPKEVVIMLVDPKHENKPDYQGGVDCPDDPDTIKIYQEMSHHDEFISMIEAYLGDYLYYRTDKNIALADLKIGELAKDGPKVIIIYTKDEGDADFLWREPKTTHTLWADVDLLELLIDKQQNYINHHYQPVYHHDDPEHIPPNPAPCDKTLLELQWTLTPQPDNIDYATKCYLWNERLECDERCPTPPFPCTPDCIIFYENGVQCFGAPAYESVHELSEDANPYLEDFIYNPDQKNIDIIRVDFFEETSAVEIAIDKSCSALPVVEITSIDGNQEGLDKDLFELEPFFNDKYITANFMVTIGCSNCNLTINDIFPSHGVVTSFEAAGDGVFKGKVVIDPYLLVGRVNFVITATDSCGKSSAGSTSFEVVLKVLNGNLVIKPESLKVNPGEFHASVVFPFPYDASTITDAVADGAPHQKINRDSVNQKAVIKFNRADISDELLDTHFIVTGHFQRKGAICWFQGSDEIMKVERKNGNPDIGKGKGKRVN